MLPQRHIKLGGYFKALDEVVLMAPLDSRYTQVRFNHVYLQLCDCVVLSKCQNFNSSVSVFYRYI